MGSITDKVNAIAETKRLLKNSIINKGVEVSDQDTFRSYANKIRSINEGSGGSLLPIDAFKNVPEPMYCLDLISDIDWTKYNQDSPNSDPLSLRFLYAYCPISNINLYNLDTTNKTSMHSMFDHCINVKTIDLSYLNLKKINKMSYAFLHCINLENIIWPETKMPTGSPNKLNFENVFENCSILKRLDFSFWNANLSSFHDPFSRCISLEYLDITGFNTDACDSITLGYELSNLTTMKFPLNFGSGANYIYLNSAPLSHASLIDNPDSLINRIADVSNNSSNVQHDLRIKNVGITEEEKQRFIKKGWHIVLI